MIFGMRSIRYLLIVASFGMVGFLIYISMTERINSRLAFGSLIAVCLLNGVYLAWIGPPASKPQKSRIFGLLGLWLDAKEGELRSRAERSKSEQ